MYRNTFKHTLTSILIQTFLFCLITTSVDAQSNTILQTKIDKNVSQGDFKTANISLAVVDLESGKLIGEHRANKLLTPASSLKLFTTFTALETLGENFQFETSISYRGSIDKEGTLKGDIIIVGGGDPTLGTTKLKGTLSFNELINDIVKKIKAAGINCIDGTVIADESIYDSYPVAPTWQWNDLGNYYASGAWGININENLYYIYFNKRDIIGAKPNIQSIFPKVYKLKLSNELTVDSAHTGDNAYIFGGPYNYDKRIVGTIPQGKGLFTIKGSIPDPPSFFAHAIFSKLNKQKIKSEGYKTVYKSERGLRKKIATYRSPTLDKIVKKANFESNNLYTESMLKMIGLKERGLGSGQNGIAVINKILRKSGIKPKELMIRDGSGLSARNNISSYSMAQFLYQMSKSIDVETLNNYLPRGGYSGTVSGMFVKSKAKGNVWLKSGSMEGVQSYSGFIRAKSGKWVSFSIIVNGFTTKGSIIRAKLDKLIRDIYTAC